MTCSCHGVAVTETEAELHPWDQDLLLAQASTCTQWPCPGRLWLIKAQDIRAELQSTSAPQSTLKLSVAGVSYRKKHKFPREEAGVEPWFSAPSGQQNRGSSSSILGLPRGFMAQLSLLPHFWHPDSGSWVVLLHLELCFLALEFGIIACSSLSLDASRAALRQRGEQTHPVGVFVSHKMPVRQRKGPHETGIVVALAGTKAPSTALGKGRRAGKCVYSSSLISYRVQTTLFTVF